MTTKDESDFPELFLFSVDRAMVEEAIKEALKSAFMRSEDFQRAVSDQVRMMVRQELMKNNESLDHMREDIQKMIERFPAITSDPQMMTSVAQALIGHFQK